ncbi:MAG: phosphoribosylformylglycinamidine cyclo-ligase [Peptoniphilaceae bacterium]|jgi:phosphoribosylformylglycinamidine cyclo-ligase
MGLNYKEAGVDKEAGYREVQLIKEHVARTKTPGTLSDIGGFSGVFQPDLTGMTEPVLVSGTDGVGTKLKLAFLTEKHDTIGQDAVAMCVNDILCQGAKPLFFLDYLATGVLEPEKMAKIVKGVADGCVLAGCALIGGETAEMPGFYAEGEYDIAGFAVGICDKKDLLEQENVQEKDVLIGLPSSGLHSNGFSLVRKIVFDRKEIAEDFTPEGWETSLFETLLTPTRIYVPQVLPLLEKKLLHAAVHITGGGFYENLPRAIPEGLCAQVDTKDIQTHPVFSLLQEWGGIATREMYATFNMGVGMVLFVAPENKEPVLHLLTEAGESPLVLGQVGKGTEKVQVCLPD